MVLHQDARILAILEKGDSGSVKGKQLTGSKNSLKIANLGTGFQEWNAKFPIYFYSS
jgi:hypothetical protein